MYCTHNLIRRFINCQQKFTRTLLVGVDHAPRCRSTLVLHFLVLLCPALPISLLPLLLLWPVKKNLQLGQEHRRTPHTHRHRHRHTHTRRHTHTYIHTHKHTHSSTHFTASATNFFLAANYQANQSRLLPLPPPPARGNFCSLVTQQIPCKIRVHSSGQLGHSRCKLQTYLSLHFINPTQYN